MKKTTLISSITAAALACMLACLVTPAPSFAGESSCLTCHLCGPMLVKNRSVAAPTVSAMQSGAG